MTDNKTDNFNIRPLVSEIENVIKNGLNIILKDYVTRCESLENTHSKILSVLNELNKDESQIYTEKIYTEKTQEDVSMFISIKDITQELVTEEVKHIENKLDKLEKQFNSIIDILDKMFNNVKSLNEDVKLLKMHPSVTEESVKNICKPQIVSVIENENIKLEINEDESDGSEEELEQESDEESDDESDEESDEEPEEEKTKEPEKSDEELEEESDEELEQELQELEQELQEPEQELQEPEQELQEPEQELQEPEQELQELQEEEPEESEEEIETEKSVSEDEEEQEQEEEEEEEEEFFEIEIDDVTYCTNNEDNGLIYEVTEDGELGEKVGYLKEGEPFFYADEK
jgi:chromosome segregation ATPase